MAICSLCLFLPRCNQKILLKTAVLKNSKNDTSKYPCWSPFLNGVADWRYATFFQNETSKLVTSFIVQHLWAATCSSKMGHKLYFEYYMEVLNSGFAMFSQPESLKSMKSNTKLIVLNINSKEVLSIYN